MRVNKLALLAVLLVLVLAPAAFADTLAKVGPIVPYNATAHTGNGYPKYYMDHNGAAADLQVPPFGDALTAPTMIFGPVLAGTTDQFTLDIGFDAECFIWHILPDRATFDDVIGANLNILIGLEAGFALTGANLNGQQAVWQRIRFLWASLGVPGTFLFKHPYGVETMSVTLAELGSQGGAGLHYTVDSPNAIAIPPFNFSLALGDNPLAPGKIGPFLHQVNPPVQITVKVPPIPPPYNKPTDWFGDGVTAATFTGSPLNPPFNKFRIEAYTDATLNTPMNIFPTAVGGLPTVNFVETSLGVIAGHQLHFANLAGLEMLLLLD